VTELAASLTGSMRALQAAYENDARVREAFDRKRPTSPAPTSHDVERFHWAATFVRRSSILDDVHQIPLVGFNSRLTITARVFTTTPTFDLFVPMLVDFDEWQDQRRPQCHRRARSRRSSCSASSRSRGACPAAARAPRAVDSPMVAFDPRREVKEAPDTLEIDAPPPTAVRPDSWTTVAAVPEHKVCHRARGDLAGGVHWREDLPARRIQALRQRRSSSISR